MSAIDVAAERFLARISEALRLEPDNVDALASRLLPREVRAKLKAISVHDDGYGYDAFGANAAWVKLGIALTHPLYHRWFRVTSSGIENIPDHGAAILASNHSGTIPLDAMMIASDVVRHSRNTRVPRMIVDNFVPKLPFVSTFFARCGAVGGSRDNLGYLLKQGELVGLFPEGVPGIGKPFNERYQLQSWRPGHVEFAIKHGVPVIPVAVIGAEEQLPQIARIKAPKSLGIPYLPITLTPVPLPVKYRIYYGKPIRVAEGFTSADARDPGIVAEQAQRVKSAVQRLIERGLSERGGVFS